MKQCVKCTSVIDDNAIFCSVCGTKQPVPEEQTIFCSQCGKKIEIKNTKCPYCSSTISATVKANKSTPVIVNKLVAPFIAKGILLCFAAFIDLMCSSAGFSTLRPGENMLETQGRNTAIFILFFILMCVSLTMGIQSFIQASKIKTDYFVILAKIPLKNSIPFYIYCFGSIFCLAAFPNCVTWFIAILTMATFFVHIIGIRRNIKKNASGYIALAESKMDPSSN